MPTKTYYNGALETDKAIPSNICEQLDFLASVDTRVLTAPLQDPLGTVIPEGFPIFAVAELTQHGMYHCDFSATSDTEIGYVGEDGSSFEPEWIAFIIETFLAPAGIKVTGRIEAEEESGELWSLVVGDDQVVRVYDGRVVYTDQPGYPHPTETPVEQAPASVHDLFDQVRKHPQFAFGAIFVAADFPGHRIPDSLTGHVEENMLAQYGSELIRNQYGAPGNPYCEECGANTEPTFESAPGAFHHESCSLHVADGDNP